MGARCWVTSTLRALPCLSEEDMVKLRELQEAGDFAFITKAGKCVEPKGISSAANLISGKISYIISPILSIKSAVFT